MGKEIHFYESKKVQPADVEILHDWESVDFAIENEMQVIHTTQMCMLKTSYIYGDDYRLFVHQGDGKSYEVKIRKPGVTADQWTIREHQNAYGAWAGGMFRV